MRSTRACARPTRWADELRHPAACPAACSAQEAARDEHARDDGRPARPSVGGVPDAPLQPRLRQPRPRREDDPRHERARAGGQVDHRLQPRRRAGARREAGRARRSRPAAPGGAASSSASRPAHPGVTNVVLGQVSLEQALVEVFHATAGGGVDYIQLSRRTGTGRRRPRSNGVLAVLVAGQLPSDAGEFVELAAAAPSCSPSSSLRFDVVLIDTPPLLSVGDAMTLSAHVDGMMAVARLEMLKRPVLAGARRGPRDLPDGQARLHRHRRRVEPGYGQPATSTTTAATAIDVNLPRPRR